MARRRPLPGIRFEGRTPPVRDTLPRMDIAAFVGFAAAGPIDVPVPIDDPAQFRMIFGGDVALPSPAKQGEIRTGHLAGTVRAFFNNGGRRCWIVRVARPTEDPNAFPIPGLWNLSATNALTPASMTARSEGSWSDTLRVRTNLTSRALKLRRFNGAPAPTIDIDIASPKEIVPGDLVRVTWAGVDAALYLFVENIGPTPASPLDASSVARRLSGRSLWLGGDTVQPAVQAAPDPATLTGNVLAERLTFDLTVVDQGRTDLWTLTQLGFAPDHPRYVAALPSDAVLFEKATDAQEAAPPTAQWKDLWREASRPRFPLASAVANGLYIPATMSTSGSAMVAPTIPAAPSLVRDGLAVFDVSLFIDHGLLDATLRDTVDRADAIRYRAIPPRRLTGLHAVMAIEEVTAVAVPDAVHGGWDPAIVLPIASPLASSPLDHPEWWRWVDCRAPRPDPPPPPFSGFVDCAAAEPIAPPLLEPGPVANGSFDLHWTPLEGSTDEIQEASRFDFLDAVTIFTGANGVLRLYNRAPGDHFYRARRLVGSRTSDWSIGLAVRVPSLAAFEARGTYDDGTLLQVQRALVRMCAACADRVAMLSLPRHYDDASAVAHVARLTSTPIEPAALSYAATWHPWLIARDVESGDLRAGPPEGAMAGVIAARALARGAWVAPANETVRRTVALDPSIPAAARQAIQDAAINLIRQEPYGFVCLNADTLSVDEELRPLNVRRLLILVRRAALRAGNRFTFEPHGDRLRRAVKRGFEAVLEEMFSRGAFAGARAADAFRVSTDDAINPPAGVDAGRFVAEIRVAPSRPLSFLTVRLVQRGDSTIAQEVR